MYKIISFGLCPFVQRSIITLNHKNVGFEVEYIDLENKPDWFLKISPTGKVPVLQTNDGILFESAVINEFIDETTEGSLLSSDPFKRAKQRAFIDYASTAIMNYFHATISKDEQGFLQYKDLLEKNLEFLLAEFKGPYFNGDQLSLVDTSVIPLLQRLKVTGNFLNELNLKDETRDKVNAWTNSTLDLLEVKNSVPKTFYEDYDSYLKKRESYIYLRSL